MDNHPAFSDSNDGGSSSMCCTETAAAASFRREEPTPDVAALRRLSENLESVLESGGGSDYFSDAKIVVTPGNEVSVHRCILAGRSSFFKKLFDERKDSGQVTIELKVLIGSFRLSSDALVAVLSYLYTGRVKPLLRSVCTCLDGGCDHVACRPALDFLLEILFASHRFQVAELVALYQRRMLDAVDRAVADDVLAVLAVVSMCDGGCERLQARCVDIVVRSDIDAATLHRALPPSMAEQVVRSRRKPVDHRKHASQIHKALESDDVELVRMLLNEGHTTVDGARALHYAVAHCDAKTTTELLDLGNADVNLRNSRGHTVLHVAAMRKEPQIIVSLLTKGARTSDVTPDGRKAMDILKRMTRAVDYYRPREEGKETPKDRLCVEILEQAESKDTLLCEASVSLAVAGDDLRMKLLYLENRVGLAKLLFPMEARVAMDIAQVDGTSEFSLAGRTPTVDLNEAPFVVGEEHLSRIRALSKTVELGKRFFPRCSEVLNKIMDADDLGDLAYMNNDTTEERQAKKRRYVELQDALSKAFNVDKEEFNKSAASSSSSCNSGVKRKSSRNSSRRKFTH